MSKEGSVTAVGGYWSAKNFSSFMASGSGASEPLKIFQKSHSEVFAVSQLSPCWTDLGYLDENCHMEKSPNCNQIN